MSLARTRDGDDARTLATTDDEAPRGVTPNA